MTRATSSMFLEHILGTFEAACVGLWRCGEPVGPADERSMFL